METHVNFYKHHLGDYAKKTAVLTIAEHGAYLLMLHHYYGTEAPLPTGRDLYRLLRAETKPERAAVDTIVRKFWIESDGGLINERAQEEIERASHQRDVNREIGKLGGRPRGTDSETDSVSEREPHAHETDPVSEPIPNRNPSQTPDSRLQTNPRSKDSGANAPVASPPAEALPGCPFDEIIDAYHSALPTCPQVLIRNKSRDGLMRSRWREVFASGKAKDRGDGIELFREFFGHVAESKFLTGRAEARNGTPPFVADLEWLMRPTNFAKVVEGRYHRG